MSKPADQIGRQDDAQATQVVHAGRTPSAHFGAVSTPVYRVSTILHPTVTGLETSKQAFTYGRRGNPTTRSLEDALCQLSGGADCVLTPSGLSAVAVALMTVMAGGGHLLVSDSAYEPSRDAAVNTLSGMGVHTEFFDPLAGAAIVERFLPATKAILVESPGSLTFEMQDIPAIAAAARARGIAVVADNTWATPLLCKPLAMGVDLQVEALTKYVVGHADASIGAVIANAAWAKRLRHLHGALGQCASPDDAFLASRGLRTLAVRLPQHEANARALIAWLQTRPEVARVLYPGLEGDPGYPLWRRDCTGACGLFGVALKPMARAGLEAMLDGLRLFGMGWSWGGFESLVVTARPKRNIRPWTDEGPLLRLHAGLEDPKDLIADLAAGFDRAKAIV